MPLQTCKAGANFKGTSLISRTVVHDRQKVILEYKHPGCPMTDYFALFDGHSGTCLHFAINLYLLTSTCLRLKHDVEFGTCII